MSKLNKQLIGSDLCNCECLEYNSIIHPETNTNQLLVGDSNVSLEDWFKNEALGNISDYSGLKGWLLANYPIESYVLPKASSAELGGIKVGNYLTIDNLSGVLSVDTESLAIPDVATSTFDIEGVIKLGNNALITSNFSETSIEDTDPYYFPVRLDSNNRAGISIEKSLFKRHQVDWNNNIISSVEYIKNKPILAPVATSGSYNDLTDKPNYASVMHYKGTVAAYTDLEGIESPEVGDVYNVSSTGTNYAWSGTAWDALGSTINIGVATSDNLGLIKVGYSSTDNRKAIQLDSNNKAFVELKAPTGAWIGNGLNQHYFSVEKSQNSAVGYVPLIKITEVITANEPFRVNTRFEIISRHSKNYIGEFYINYRAPYNGITSCENIIDIKCISTGDTVFKESDIIACVFDENGNRKGSSSFTTAHYMIIYRYIGNISTYNYSKDVFILNILGNNDTTINTIRYYCTNIYSGNGDEVVINNTSVDQDSAIITNSLTTDLTHIPS